MVVEDAAVGHGEAHASSFADFLRREEWLENFLLSFFIDAATVVFYFYADIVFDVQVFVWTLVPFICHVSHGLGAKGDSRIFRVGIQGIASIDEKIEQDLLKLRGVAADGRQIWFDDNFEFDVFGRGLEELSGLFDKCLQINGFDMELAFPCKRQQLGGEA